MYNVLSDEEFYKRIKEIEKIIFATKYSFQKCQFQNLFKCK